METWRAEGGGAGGDLAASSVMMDKCRLIIKPRHYTAVITHLDIATTSHRHTSIRTISTEHTYLRCQQPFHFRLRLNSFYISIYSSIYSYARSHLFLHYQLDTWVMKVGDLWLKAYLIFMLNFSHKLSNRLVCGVNKDERRKLNIKFLSNKISNKVLKFFLIAVSRRTVRVCQQHSFCVSTPYIQYTLSTLLVIYLVRSSSPSYILPGWCML